jgi:CRP/FNR family cyclic AMP-dependent transcriptional regulator
MIPRRRLQAIPFFAALPPRALGVMAARAEEVRFDPADTIFKAGAEATCLLVVLEGRVRLVRRAGERAPLVHLEGIGATLGEVSLLAGGPHPTSAIAIEPTTCAALTRDAIGAALKTSPDASFVLLQRLARRVHDLVERLDRLAMRPVSARLAEFLIKRADARRRSTIAIGMTQEQLAEELGTVREVVARELHALREAGLLRSLGPGRFEIVDATALRSRADQPAVVAEPTVPLTRVSLRS